MFPKILAGLSLLVDVGQKGFDIYVRLRYLYLRRKGRRSVLSKEQSKFLDEYEKRDCIF